MEVECLWSQFWDSHDSHANLDNSFYSLYIYVITAHFSLRSLSQTQNSTCAVALFKKIVSAVILMLSISKALSF